MILGCIGAGTYAIVKRTLPIGPRRKVIDGPAIRLGVVLVALPFVNALILYASLWMASSYFPDSKTVDHWSVPKHYTGDWASYTPYQAEQRRPDFSMFDTSDTESHDDR